MSEGTPGRGPDAEPRTEDGDGQTSTSGRPVVPPVRYGPRNAGPSNGRGSSSPTVPGTSSPQQYRPPQPPRAPAYGGTGPGANGSGADGAGTNGSGSNGSGSNGAHPVTPGSYTRPRPNGTAGRPDPTEQERLVADARTAAAARNASASRVRGGSAFLGRPSTTTEPRPNGRTPDQDADETTAIPVVPAADDAPTTTAVPSEAPAPADETATPEKGRTVLGRLRDRRGNRTPQEPAADAAVADPASDSTVETPKAAVAGVAEKADDQPGAEPSTTAPSEQEPATEERPLTWRDRLGIAPKTPKPQPVDVPDSGPGVPTAAAAAALAAGVAEGSAPPETKASPTAPTSAPQAAVFTGRVTPSSPVASTGPDTAIIPAVEAGALSPAAPAAAATAQPLVNARPRVGAARRTRKARLRLSRVDPWSVMKTALLFSIAAGIILVVATYGVWSVLNASGLFAAVDDMVKSVVSTPGDTTPFRIEEYVNTQKIIGVAALIAVVDVLIFTALATLGSFLYNLAATVLGGLEVTLAED